MTKKAYAQLVEKESYEEGDYALIITSDHKEYHSLSEFLDNEEIDALLLPFDLPEEFNIDSIQVYDYGEYRKISLSILNNESDINISIFAALSIVVTGAAIGSSAADLNQNVFCYKNDREVIIEDDSISKEKMQFIA